METLDLTAIRSTMSAIDGGRTEVKLIAGDVRFTCKKFVDENPGFKISFLNMDLDLAEPTMEALKALWPRVSVGGVVVFDEYAVPRLLLLLSSLLLALWPRVCVGGDIVFDASLRF